MKKSNKKSFVYRSTIWKSVGGSLNYPNESKVCNVGTRKVLITRSKNLDKYGNPIHTATMINKDGSTGKSYRTNGGATNAVSTLFRKCGIDIKNTRRKKR